MLQMRIFHSLVSSHRKMLPLLNLIRGRAVVIWRCGASAVFEGGVGRREEGEKKMEEERARYDDSIKIKRR